MGLKTARLYHQDSYQTEFQARVLERSPDGLRLYLDRTAFYPDSGGQPHDSGWIEQVPVREVLEEGDLIAHVLESPVTAETVHGRIDWARRFDHMQQHSGQHLLSAVMLELYGAPTVGFHLGAEAALIDLQIAALRPEQVAQAEARANELVFRNLPIRTHWEEEGAQELRRGAGRQGPLRIVTIEGVDRTACGGTHVRATGEIGPIFIRKLDRAHGGVRLEFVCGARAVRRARADFEALSQIARTLSAALEETPRLVAEQAESLQKCEKARRKLALELAERRGRELYAAVRPDSSGFRCLVQFWTSGSFDEERRTLAQSFTAQPKAVCLALTEQPPAILLAVSQDSGWNAGALLKAALAAVGGRGGGGPCIAQGSAPSREAFEEALRSLAEAVSPLRPHLMRR